MKDLGDARERLPGSKFLIFYAVFGRNWLNSMLASSQGWVPLGNSRSATLMVKICNENCLPVVLFSSWATLCTSWLICTSDVTFGVVSSKLA